MAKLIDIIGRSLSGEWGSDDETGNGIPVLRTTNFTNEGIVDYKDVVTRKITKKNIEEKFLCKGDIIIEKSGGSDKYPVGRVVYFDGEEHKYLFNNFTGLLRVKNRKEWYPKYVFYSLFANYRYGGTRIYENKTTGLHNLKTDDYVSRYEITDIGKAEQISICKKLDILQGIIKTRKRELQLLDELIKARFVEMFGDPVANDKRWDTLSLENACKTIIDCPHSTPSYTYENTGFMCIRTSIVKKNRILWDDIEYIPEDEFEKRIQRKQPTVGDIVYTREGAILGIAAIIDRNYNVALGQRSMLLSPDTDKCASEFLCVAMNSDSFLDNVLKGVSGSASPHINVGDIKAFKMIMPPVELQNQFAAFIHQVDKSKLLSLIKLLEQLITYLYNVFIIYRQDKGEEVEDHE